MSKLFTANHLLKKNNFSEALPLLEAIVEEEPENTAVMLSLGKTYFALNMFKQAYDAFAFVWSIDQSDTNVLHFASRALYRAGNYQEALRCAHELLNLEKPDQFNLMTRGLAAQKLGRVKEASADFEAILELEPENPDALHNLATLRAGEKRYAESVQLFERSYSLDNNNKAALANAIYYARTICAWIVEKKYERDIVQLGVCDGQTISPFSMLCLDDDAERHQKRSQNYWRTMTRGIQRVTPRHVIGQRIRIGYFSSDIYDHATMHLFADVLRHHDRDKFEIFGYVIKNIKNDKVAASSKALFDVVKDVSNLSDEKIAEVARLDNIDIAVDLKGHTSASRPRIFAHGAGKVQVNYLGYPGSMGADQIDVIIADQCVIPHDHLKFYDEKVLWMPSCSQPNRSLDAYPDIKVTRAQFNLPDEVPVLASFNASYKIGLTEFILWLRLLIKHPTAVLWIFCDNDEAYLNLRHMAEQFGIADGRLVRAKPVPHDIHLARISLADIFLDTFNVCAHTTASDALRAGLPVVTKCGNGFASRVAASLLTACGLDDWITYSEEQYFEKIDEYLSRKKFKAAKAHVRQSVSESSLFKPEVYVRELETKLLEAYESVIPKKKQLEGALVGDKGSCLLSNKSNFVDGFIAASNCTFCMPSNRNFANSKRSIESLVKLKSKGFNVVVSDNSGDRLKLDFLKDHGIVVDSGPEEASENFNNVLSMATTPYLSLIGDDDWIELDFGTFDEHQIANFSSDCVGFRPSINLYNPHEDSIAERNNFYLIQSNPLERIAHYNMSCRGTNETYYSLWDATRFKKVQQILFADNPLSGSWTDWSVVWAMLSTGQMQNTKSYTFNYNLDNWATAESISVGIERSLLKAGLDQTAGQYLQVLQALDFLGLALGINSDSGKMSESLVRDIKGWFLVVLGVLPKQTSVDIYTLVEQRFHQSFIGAIEIAEKIKPGLGGQYKRYCELALDFDG